MRESTLWFWHIVAGTVIFFLLGIHMFIMHLDEILGVLGIGYHDPISSESVFMRSQQVFFMITYIILLSAALYHGLYGFRTMLFELTLSRTLEKLINWSFAIVGFALFAYGTYAAIFVFTAKFMSKEI
jgi:succinate dehydrogenase hydrophobic anchor subunit